MERNGEGLRARNSASRSLSLAMSYVFRKWAAPALAASLALLAFTACTQADATDASIDGVALAEDGLAASANGSPVQAQAFAPEDLRFRTAWGSRVIVVLGSSTAAGVGPKRWDGAWVERYRAYLRQSFPNFEVVNLALGGATTYSMQPTDFAPPANRGAPDTTHNITHALTFHPDAIIINMPTNDAAARYPVWEQIANYGRVYDFAAARGIPVWVTTTQPRNFPDVAQRNDLIAGRDAIRNRFGAQSLDFWSHCAQWDGTVQPRCDSGDGIHLNDEAHGMMVQPVIWARIPETVLSRSP